MDAENAFKKRKKTIHTGWAQKNCTRFSLR